MKRIGLISDTHSFLDEKVFHYFKDCDEIWHAGDIGNPEVADQLEAFKTFKAVYGNIDSTDIRVRFSEDLHFTCEGLKIWMTHIGGVPPKYNTRVRPLIAELQPAAFHLWAFAYSEDYERSEI